MPLTESLEGYAENGSYLMVSSTSFEHLRYPEGKERIGKAGAAHVKGFEYAEFTNVVVDGTAVADKAGGLWTQAV